MLSAYMPVGVNGVGVVIVGIKTWEPKIYVLILTM